MNVLYGSAGGLTGSGSQLFTQVGGAVEAGDGFGWALAVGDFDNGGFADLAVGAPFEDVGRTIEAGAVSVLYGSSGGLSRAGGQLFTQNSPGVPGNAGDDDLFGDALVSGDPGPSPASTAASGPARARSETVTPEVAILACRAHQATGSARGWPTGLRTIAVLFSRGAGRVSRAAWARLLVRALLLDLGAFASRKCKVLVLRPFHWQVALGVEADSRDDAKPVKQLSAKEYQHTGLQRTPSDAWRSRRPRALRR